MKIIFFGNTKYSLIGAKIIHQQIGISQIVTIPDGPLSQFAKENNIPTVQTSKLTDEILSELKSMEPDFLVVEDYGLILPKRLLDIPKKASINVHHSLLPKYRGPSPAPFAILEGEKTSGVSIIHMSEKVDAGDVYDQVEYKLTDDETTDSLLTKLNQLGGELAVKVINEIVEKKAKAVKQDEGKVTYTKMLKKEDGFIDITNPPDKEKASRMIRAFYPWPGVWTKAFINSKELIIKLLPEQTVQVEGKKPQSFKDFINGYKEGEEILTRLKLN